MSKSILDARKQRMSIGKSGAWLFLGVMLFISLFPVFWMLRTALSPNGNLFGSELDLFPEGMSLNNFKRILGFSTLEEAQAMGGSGASLNFLLYLWNSVKFTAVIVFGTVFTAVCGGYALARLNFRGRNAIFYILMSGLLVPAMFATIPNFILIIKLGLLNTFIGSIAPFVLGTPFAVFFMRQFFISFPKEIEEAAEIDGLGVFGRLRLIVLPMSLPPIFTLALITGVTAWNEYLWPYLVANDENQRVLTVGLRIFLAQSPSTSPDWSGLMAATTLTVIPVVIILALFGKKMIGSIQLGGFK
ncbi:UgpE ABC-type sugar transport system, permease component [Candidatus Nanopelagicaceae bacterium]